MVMMMIFQKNVLDLNVMKQKVLNLKKNSFSFRKCLKPITCQMRIFVNVAIWVRHFKSVILNFDL